MIYCYKKLTSSLQKINLCDHGEDTLWVDLLYPTPEERKQIEELYNISIPNLTHILSIEESSRLYVEKDIIYLTLMHLYCDEKRNFKITPVTFIHKENKLITIRYLDSLTLDSFINKLIKGENGLIKEDTDNSLLMIIFINQFVEQLADLIETNSLHIDNINSFLFYENRHEATPMTPKEFRAILQQIGREGSLISRARENLSRIKRFLIYAANHLDNNKNHESFQSNTKKITRDIESLESYANYLSNKVNFLLDTVVGLISTDQNAIIKIFSVVAVAFMPPTLIASIYGMNFAYMPELNSIWGYPITIIAMLLSALGPLWYFKKKGWL
ncbi:CorA family divalent cation transporter [Bartonella sp. DGB1]|uniref:CorA family divalent cation transporter n=1 Tax=Bartonella sp. DGB1 TaxID=3239807 RepID=UPI0035262269